MVAHPSLTHQQSVSSCGGSDMVSVATAAAADIRASWASEAAAAAAAAAAASSSSSAAAAPRAAGGKKSKGRGGKGLTRAAQDE